MRLSHTEEALDRLAKTTDFKSVEGYNPVLQVAKEIGLESQHNKSNDLAKNP